MFDKRWIYKLFFPLATFRGRGRQARAGRPRGRWTPRLEMLENRWLPSAVMVTTNLDLVDAPNTSSIPALMANPGADGKISLREAVLASNNTAGADSITFDPSLSG